MPPRPVEIHGGGLAGLALGIALRRHDVPVTLHEAGTYPRHRVCGEFITGLSTATLEALELTPVFADALLHHDARWFERNTAGRRQSLPAPALAISRYELDARLARRFVAAGGDLRPQSRITGREDIPGCVDATGRRPSSRSPWLGLKFHAHGLDLDGGLEMHLGRQCYVGLTRVAADTVNVCGLFERRSVSGQHAGLLPAYLASAGLTDLAARVARARPDPATFCAVAGLDFNPTDGSDRGLRLGDAAAMIPPFTGNGMAMALQSAECALGPLTAYARGTTGWAAACTAVRAALHRRFQRRLVSASWLHPFLLQPRRQRWFTALHRARLLPFGPLYAALH